MPQKCIATLQKFVVMPQMCVAVPQFTTQMCCFTTKYVSDYNSVPNRPKMLRRPPKTMGWGLIINKKIIKTEFWALKPLFCGQIYLKHSNCCYV